MTSKKPSISLALIRQQRMQQRDEEEEEYVLAADHMEEDVDVEPNPPLPKKGQLTHALNYVFGNIAELRDALEHVFVTIDAMDENELPYEIDKDILNNMVVDSKRALASIDSMFKRLL